MEKRNPKIPEALRQWFVEQGRIGGKAGGSAGGKKRTGSMTPAQRRELAKQAASARWKGHTRKTKPRRKKPTD